MNKNGDGSPLVSVVMSCYNSEKYLKEAIDSILNQSYKNFEFIIWNDGSKDSSEDIIKEYTDSRIRYFFHENTGLGTALNLACKEAKGKYIARMDSDDISLPTRLEEEVDYLENHENVVLLSCLAELMDDNGNFLGYGLPYSTPKIIKKHPGLIYHPGVMMRADAYKKTTGYPLIRTAEDLFLWYSMFNYGDVKIIKYPLLKYRVTSGSLSSNWNDYMINNMTTLWKIIANKPIVGEVDFQYIDYFIKQNITINKNRNRGIRTAETKFIKALSLLLPFRLSYRIAAAIKNFAGLIKIR